MHASPRSTPDHSPRARFWHTPYAAWAIVGCAFLVAALLTRVAMLAMNGSFTTNRPIEIAQALAVGEWYDVLAALWLTLPFALFITTVRRAWWRTRVARGLLRAGIALSLIFAIFVAAAEIVFFDEFNGRFNFVAVDYLLFPTEVVTNIWESYNVAWILSGIALLALAILWMLRAPIRRALEDARPRGWRARFILLYAVVLGGVTVATSPALARVSDDRALNEIATSGYYTFWGALLGQDAPYEGLYATRPDSVVFPRLRQLLSEPATGPLAPNEGTVRRVNAIAPARRMNVVVVLEESFGATLVSALHPRDSASLTPSFDSLTTEGTLLTNAFSTGNRTIRALEATTSSLPPLPGISIVRRPQSVGLFTLPSVLRANGYSTTFIYGGRALFDGMGAYMRNNGMERIIEQKDFPDTSFKTAWGVSDEAIFDRTLAELDSLHATGKPFYTLVLSVSNHKPYTYPRGRIPQNPDEHRRIFAVRYADWALGRFMRQASSHAFFSNTLFVLMGDHGARVYGASEIPLPSYEVPVLFYAPGFIPAGERLGTLTSSLDIPPTILGLLGLSYESKFFGRDVFRIAPDEGRALMTHNNVVALMQGSRIAVLGLRGSTKLFERDSSGGLRPIIEPDAAGRALIEDAIAYFTGADRLYRSGRYRFGVTVAER